MKIEDIFKNIAIPLISVLTAVMVGLLNHQVSKYDIELRERDQKLQESLAEIDLLVKRNKEDREERESNQDFNLKIYEIVTKSLEESSAQKQDAAKAFVLVMVEEPLRSSLLNVLKQGAEPDIKANISQILKAESKFKTNIAAVPTKKREETSTYNWGKWDFDIFWCSSSGVGAMTKAQQIGEQLLAEGAQGRVRIRELPDSINAKAGYQISGYTIRRNSGEENAAMALKLLSEKATEIDGKYSSFSLGLSGQSTPWYISAFVCPDS